MPIYYIDIKLARTTQLRSARKFSPEVGPCTFGDFAIVRAVRVCRPPPLALATGAVLRAAAAHHIRSRVHPEQATVRDICVDSSCVAGYVGMTLGRGMWDVSRYFFELHG